MPEKKKKQPQNIQQTAIGDGIVQVAGDNNTVNIIQKFFNIFKSDAETVEQRNRRIMLNHVENFWVKGILEKSLHGAALLELGIKEDPDALSYPWAIKREATKESLPAGMSMLEIFQEIGMGRSLLILGAPGSGKTTMLLELTRQLIERACEDVTEPIPVVFNLSSWTEKLSLADWLARELNDIYTIPKKVAPTWVNENKMLLLLDGLDEVKQEVRDRCVDAINQFKQENGQTCIVVCSRSEEYSRLKEKLALDGAIEIQPLTTQQVKHYFQRFGRKLAGTKNLLEKDTALREMAESPLFLSIMTMAYRNTDMDQIRVSSNLDEQRKYLFDTYIERMFTRPERSKDESFRRQDVLHWLSWLAQKMIEHNSVPYLLENMQPKWHSSKIQVFYKMVILMIFALPVGFYYGFVGGILEGLCGGIIVALSGWLSETKTIDNLTLEWRQRGKRLLFAFIDGSIFGLFIFLTRSHDREINANYEIATGLFMGMGLGLFGWLIVELSKIDMVDALTWNLKQGIKGLIIGLCSGLLIGYIFGSFGEESELISGMSGGVIIGIFFGFIKGLTTKQLSQTNYVGQKVASSLRNFFFVFLSVLVLSVLGGASVGIIFGFAWLFLGLLSGLLNGLLVGLIIGLFFGGLPVIQHYILRFILARNKLLPWRLVPFLDYCVDRIFLRRVGGGYIFVHRLLMEHFAAMYQEEPK